MTSHGIFPTVAVPRKVMSYRLVEGTSGAYVVAECRGSSLLIPLAGVSTIGVRYGPISSDVITHVTSEKMALAMTAVK
jgi:hypothetical protein